MVTRRTGAWIFSRVFENKSFQYRISSIHNSNMEYQPFLQGGVGYD